MIITRVGGGGLGVQLFQFATGWMLAQRHEADLLVHRLTDAHHKTSHAWDYRLSGYDLGETFIRSAAVPSTLRVPQVIYAHAHWYPTVLSRRSAWIKARFQPNWDRLPDRIEIEGVRGGF